MILAACRSRCPFGGERKTYPGPSPAPRRHQTTRPAS